MQPQPSSSSSTSQPWMRRLAWSLALIASIVLVAWCGVSRYVTRLPRERPADFVLRYHGHSTEFWGGIDERFEVGLNHCVYRYRVAGYDITPESRDEVCQVSEAEVDQLYQLIRQHHFDRIRLDKSIALFGCLPSHGSEMLTVIADQQTYEVPRPSRCAVLFSGQQEWHAIDAAVQDLKWRTVGQ